MAGWGTCVKSQVCQRRRPGSPRDAPNTISLRSGRTQVLILSDLCFLYDDLEVSDDLVPHSAVLPQVSGGRAGEQCLPSVLAKCLARTLGLSLFCINKVCANTFIDVLSVI